MRLSLWFWMTRCGSESSVSFGGNVGRSFADIPTWSSKIFKLHRTSTPTRVSHLIERKIWIRWPSLLSTRPVGAIYLLRLSGFFAPFSRKLVPFLLFLLVWEQGVIGVYNCVWFKGDSPVGWQLVLHENQIRCPWDRTWFCDLFLCAHYRGDQRWCCGETGSLYLF